MTEKHKQMRLCLVRCGETTWAREKRMFGSTDLPLSNSGRAALADQVAQFQGQSLAAIFHPDDEAATETAQAIAAATHAKTRCVPELADPALGLLEGLTEHEFAERFAKRHKQWHEDPLSLLPPQGEEFGAARTRMFQAVARLLRRSRSDEVVVVMHSFGLGLLRCWLSERPASELWQMLESGPMVESVIMTRAMIAALGAVDVAEVAGES